jgi:hypothetical protein
MQKAESEVRPKKTPRKPKRKKHKDSGAAVNALESGQVSPPAPRAKLAYVAQFGNNSPVIRQLMRTRPGWAAGPGDPGNMIGKVDYEEKRVKVQISDDLNFPEIQFLWTQYSEKKFFDAMAADEYGICITLNEENKLQLRQKTLKQDSQATSLARVHNHLEGNGALCTKRGLCESMVAFYLGHRRDPFGAIPLTFVLRGGSRDDQFKEFKKAFDDIEASSGQRVWLVKPAEWSNRGAGIRLFDNLDEVENRVDSKEQTWVVQKYIEHPLLIHRRKFDVRSYCLTTQDPGGGALRAHFYREAYLRTTSAEYTTKTLDRMVHLNNDAVQKKGEDYGKFESANKLSLDDFQRYLNEHHPKDRISVKDHIVPQMQSLMADVLKSVVDRLNPRKLDHCFEVYGFDFMVDTNYRVWLIEVNTNPCLELSNSYLAQLIPKMLDEAFQLTIDRIFPHAAAPQHPLPNVQTQHGSSSRSSAARLSRDPATGTGWEQIFCSSDPNAREVSCHWVPHLTQTQEVDLASLGRDVLGMVRRQLPQPPSLAVETSTSAARSGNSPKKHRSSRVRQSIQRQLS